MNNQMVPVLSLILFLVITGCSFPAEYSNLSQSQLDSINNRDLCEAYFHGQGENVKKEIERRKLVPEWRWDAIKSNKVSEGMSECAVLAAWGWPHKIDSELESAYNQLFIYQKPDGNWKLWLKDKRVQKITKPERQ